MKPGLVMRMSKNTWLGYSYMHTVGMVDGRGYDDQQKDTICDACGRATQLEAPVFAKFDRLVVLTTTMTTELITLSLTHVRGVIIAIIVISTCMLLWHMAPQTSTVVSLRDIHANTVLRGGYKLKEGGRVGQPAYRSPSPLYGTILADAPTVYSCI